jgi:hypothetical protein
MFDMFRSTVGATLDRSPVPLGWRVPDDVEVIGFAEFMAEFGGATFCGGLYRVHDAASADVATRLVRDAFPEHADHVRAFGYDWLGRQFALHPRRRQDGQPLVLMLEPGTGDALEVPATFVAFHDEEMVEYADAVLAIHFFDEWRAANPAAVPLARDACAGYRVPLFLGGADTVDNLEVSDVDVYWTVVGQLRQQVRQP